MTYKNKQPIYTIYKIQNIKTIDVNADLISLFIIFVGDTRFELVTSTLSR